MLTPLQSLSSGKEFLFTLLLKVLVAASLAALMARWSVFRRVLYAEVRDSDLKLKLMLFLTPALALSRRCSPSTAAGTEV